jgi:hypothetical protein
MWACAICVREAVVNHGRETLQYWKGAYGGVAILNGLVQPGGFPVEERC